MPLELLPLLMPAQVIGSQFNGALRECLLAILSLVPPAQRPRILPVGGYALVMHGYERTTSVLDLLAPAEAIREFLDAAESDVQFAFPALLPSEYVSEFLDVTAHFEFVGAGSGSFCEYSAVRATVPMVGGMVAVPSLPDLFRMKCHAWCDRGEEKDSEDMGVLLALMARKKKILRMRDLSDREGEKMICAALTSFGGRKDLWDLLFGSCTFLEE